MPGEVIDRPNPPAVASHIPESILGLSKEIEKTALSENTNDSLKAFRRAACYIAAAMIFLKDNVLLERDLTFDDVKPRLLGIELLPFYQNANHRLK
jgi:xylulose-5-phosphate/fructose-6-phosphate phosphoketolase